MIAAGTKLINGVTCAGAATIYSFRYSPLTPTNSWIDTTSGEAFAVYVSANSATGNVALKIYFDMSPFTETLAFDTTDTTKYVTAHLTSGGDLVAEDTLTRYAPNDFDAPFCRARIRVVGQPGNANDTVVNLTLVQASYPFG